MVSVKLFQDLKQLIDSARLETARSVNSALIILYWSIGRRISRDVLRGKRAPYGANVLPVLSSKWVPLYGKGFDAKNLWRMVRLAENFADEGIVVTLSRQLSWSHFVAILPVCDL